MAVQLEGLFPPLALVDEPSGVQLTTHDVQNTLQLCRELMKAHALGELPENKRVAFTSQLRQLATRVRTHKVGLSGNAVRDLLGTREVKLNPGRVFAAKMKLLNLLDRALTDLTPPVALH